MAETRVHVELLACTPNPEALIYAAFRQCYHKGFVGEMWPRLLSGDIPKAQQAELIQEVLKSGHTSPIEHVQLTFARPLWGNFAYGILHPSRFSAHCKAGSGNFICAHF